MYDFSESILCYTRQWALRLLRMNLRKAHRSTKVKMETPTKTEEARRWTAVLFLMMILFCFEQNTYEINHLFSLGYDIHPKNADAL
jgi:hypothetical protein